MNKAVAFYRRHHSITGHDVEWMRAAPIGVVIAAMGNRGLTIGETLSAIRELRIAGELYELRDDHLRVT